MAKKRALRPGEERPSHSAVEGEEGGRGAGDGAQKKEKTAGEEGEGV